MTQEEIDALRLTRHFTFDCLEAHHRHFVQSVFVINGGMWRAIYTVFGVSYDVTFRTERGLFDTAERLADWWNTIVEDFWAPPDTELYVSALDIAQPCARPVRCFEVENYL